MIPIYDQNFFNFCGRIKMGKNYQIVTLKLQKQYYISVRFTIVFYSPSSLVYTTFFNIWNLQSKYIMVTEYIIIFSLSKVSKYVWYIVHISE